MSFKWKPNKTQAMAYADACRKAEALGFKLHKTANGLSIYGCINGVYTRVSNHNLPDYYTKDFDNEIICKNQKEVFKTIGVEL